MRKFLVYASPYDRRWGGVISLHKLCHLINDLGGEAYLHPSYLNFFEANFLNIGEAVQFAENQRNYVFNFDERAFVAKGLNTPVRHILNDGQYGDDWIIVYPETTVGNPLGATNVVRWFLHNPGHHFGRISYGRGEFHVLFSEVYEKYRFPTCHLSDNVLTLMDYDFNLFNTDGAPEERSGTAYCIKKGTGKPIQHELSDSTLIDHLGQEEIAKVLKSVKTFYSYDTQTAYSQLAVLCGCDSVVIPDAGVPKSEWLNGAGAPGIAYGVEEIEDARKSAHLVKPSLEKLKELGGYYVTRFINEAEAFFG